MNEKYILTIIKHLFEQHYTALHAYAKRFVSDSSAADDVVQDVFLNLWKNKENLDFEESLKPYLFRSVYNTSINYLQSKYVNLKVSIDNELDYSIQEYLNHTASYDENTILVDEIQQEIDSFLAIQPHLRSNIFYQSRRLGLSNKEVAEKLNISIKTVEKHLAIALSELREYLIAKGYSLSLVLCILTQFY